LNEDPTLVDSDPYDRGWLYEVRGEADPSAIDARGYAELLDANIDRLLGPLAPNHGEGTCSERDIS
jgi:hypothetical protein